MRAAAREDVDRLVGFTLALSQQSRYYRFFGIPLVNRASIERLVPNTPAGGMAVVGECGGRIVAFAGYYPVPGEASRAEVALAIADALQGRGIGTQLLDRLARIARSQGIAAFDAYVLGENRKMLEVFRNWGYAVSRMLDHGVYHVQLALEPTPESIEKAARRAQLAASASMKRFIGTTTSG
jgi:GNAT superfamily N-acetyltransferase